MTEADRPRPRPTAARQAGASDGVPDGGVPDGGIAVALSPAPPSGPGGSRRGRKVRRFLRSRRGKWTAASILAVLALIVGLLSQGVFSSPGDPLPDAPPAAGGGLNSLAPTPTSTSPSSRRTGPATAEDIRKELQARAGQLNNPLNQLRSPGVHNVTISVRSADKVNGVGYLIPTSINTNYAYGSKNISATSFGFSTKAVGSGYLALVFIQAGPKDIPVTCSISIDGKVTSSESTAGAYGRQICLG